MNSKLKNLIIYGLFAFAIIVTGILVDNPYYQQLITFIGINTILCVGLNMLMGYAGQISLGHAAFYGMGAYVTGILTTKYGFSPLESLGPALVLTGLVAYIIGKPMLKLTGYYLGMGTLGFGMIAYIVFREWNGLTGGASGLMSIPPIMLGGVDLSYGRNSIYLVWGVVAVAFFICQRLVDSRVGRALRAIHFSESAARAVGVDTAKAKLQVFVFSAVLGALAGFLYAHMISFISPNSFTFMFSIKLVAMVVIGGMATIWGALLGAGLLTLLPEFLHVFSDYEMLIYGLILMLVMIFIPQGLTKGILDLFGWLGKRRSKGADDKA